ncbi:RecX family transcriptional regulator [Flavobacteriaceae bacterium]|nr:RecX family transcriptional regulator [Flavobacteriaceae bacterium]MDA9374618.1 RecX family transcriptional regulator [Flavobacteriaceae bacterium]MDB4013485.1 RecX family transcriptional regulator [Flavobacteriaceae bacterium]MDB4131581.1 RecX family transcriptional regulator [Flavobacteriaceae bacterium]MDC1273908.1 RecX family transcriptional regulator [Flavobacteriaceae bacterium]
MKSGNFTVNEIEFKLKQYCSYQDRCHNEVEKKLKTFDVISEVKEQIISNLISENYLNETRFCKSFVRGKFKIKNWGKRKITLELKNRKVSNYNLKEGLKEINEIDYLDKLENIFNKKLASLDHLSLINKKKKILSFLLYRGWETNLIYEKLNQIK